MGRLPAHVRMLKMLFPYRSHLARMTRFPVVGLLIDKLFFENDDIMYIPMDASISIDEPYDVSSIVLPSVAVNELIMEGNNFWIMNFCICREAMDCKEYPHELGCLFIGEASKGIDPSIGRSVSQSEALAHVKKCRDAGLVHLIGRNKLDASWLRVSPDDKLLTICNCCPCCCLWMMLPSLSPEISKKITRMPGVSVNVGHECIGCGNCTDNICFVGAITLEDEMATISDECRGCGRCVSICPEHAIKINYEGSNSVEYALERVRAKVKFR